MNNLEEKRSAMLSMIEDCGINKSETATIVTWKELLELSIQIMQTINILVIGEEEISNLRKYSIDEQMYGNCNYVIEMKDSSYWLIHSDYDLFINDIFERLQGVEYYNS